MAKPSHILSPAERKAFDSPPLFTMQEKQHYFRISQHVKKTLGKIRSPSNQAGFILQSGYFKRAGRFFSTTRFHKQDIVFVANLLGLNPDHVTMEKYNEHTLINHKKMILSSEGIQPFEKNSQTCQFFYKEIERLVSKQVRPKRIVMQLSEILRYKKIEIPTYHLFAESINQLMNQFESKLLNVIEQQITSQQRETLDALVKKVSKVAGDEAYARSPIIQLRNIPQSSRPAKIKESVKGFLAIKELFEIVKPLLNSLNFSSESRKHYAIWVQKAKPTQLTQFTDPFKCYLYLLAFISHQYHFRQDLLVDTFIKAVQNTLNGVKKKQQEEAFESKKEKDLATQKLSTAYRSTKSVIQEIKQVLKSDELSSEEKVEEIQLVIDKNIRFNPRKRKKKLPCLKNRSLVLSVVLITILR